MVTPFTVNGRIDTEAVHRIIEHLIAGGADGIFVLGTTGEAASISLDEKIKMVEAAASWLKSRALLYAGISSSCFDESITMARNFKDLGVNILVAHVPYYYPLNEDEIFSYFKKLADSAAGPLMLYNIPQTTGISLSLDIVEKLSCHENIVGLKDSENTPGRLEAAIGRFSGRRDFSYAAGCAALSAKALSLGASGIVPSAANLQPRLYKELYENAVNGNASSAQELQKQTNQISLLYQASRSLGQSIAALKAAMHLLGLCEAAVLPPLKTLQKDDIAEMQQQMARLCLKKLMQ